MFYSLTGTVVFTDENSVAIDCSGVAFRLFVTGNTLRKCAPIGEAQTLYTHLNVREDALDLFGFAEKNELDCFKMLTSVSGVGPKAALAILSQLTPDMLAVSVAGGDVKAITAAQGVGPKIAQRVVLELKGKLEGFATSSEISPPHRRQLSAMQVRMQSTHLLCSVTASPKQVLQSADLTAIFQQKK